VIPSRIFFCAAALLIPVLRADSLEAILQRMDEGAKKLKSVSAKVHEVTYTAVIQDSTSQDGELRLRRSKNGLVGLLHFSLPDDHSVGFSGQTVEMYYPKANQVDIYHVGKDAAQLDQFILLAFGAAGSDLAKNYDVKLAGSEAIDGTSTSRLELRPKSKEAQKLATLIELWIPVEGKTSAIKEKVTEPSKNYVENTYSGTIINPGLPDSAYELKLPPGVKKINAK
jgi:outer membrane lipoprotein-sorting protein